MKKAFTLIELLVVIAIIALLIGILLPTLGKARNTARMTICMINVKQISAASINYAQDYEETLWPAAEWLFKRDTNGRPIPAELGLIWEYIDKADKITECPTNKRRDRNYGDQGSDIWEDHGTNTDYTMFDEVQGAKLGLEIEAYRTKDPSWSTPPIFRANVAESRLDPLPGGLPIFVEESVYFYNDFYTEGQWGNADQLSNRHEGGGHWSHLDNSVTYWKPPAGPRVDEFDREDFEAKEVYVKRLRGGDFYQVSDRGQPFGWINNPKYPL